MNIKFQSEQLHAFEVLSHDRNPLHHDIVYSRSTQFGRPIIFGMCGVLLGLGRWAGGRAFRLIRMQGRFIKPLFEFVEYELEICEVGNEVKIQYLEEGEVKMGFRFVWENHEVALGQTLPRQTLSTFRPLAVAVDADLQESLAYWRGLDRSYSIRTESLSQLLPKLGLRSEQIPLDQLNALMGSSYLVGMEVPGRQALYSGFDFEFMASSAEVGSADFQFHNVTADFDVRFNRISLSGWGSGMRSFTLRAFQRPKHVCYEIEDIHRAGGHSEAYKGKVVFVSGATRGFGAVLAKLLALQKAKVLINYRSLRAEAEAIAAEVRPWNPQIFPIAGDVSKPEDCQQIRAEIMSQFGRIDLLVSNAFPQILAQAFLEQSSLKFLQFLKQSVSTTVTLLYELLPLVSQGGVVMLISTCYTREPVARFSHYVAAKSCLEGLMRSLALEFPNQKFVIVRPPRMLTDQTNQVFDLSPPLSAVSVARELMERLGQIEYSSNLAELDLGRN